MCHSFEFLKYYISSGIFDLLGETLERFITALFRPGRNI